MNDLGWSEAIGLFQPGLAQFGAIQCTAVQPDYDQFSSACSNQLSQVQPQCSSIQPSSIYIISAQFHSVKSDPVPAQFSAVYSSAVQSKPAQISPVHDNQISSIWLEFSVITLWWAMLSWVLAQGNSAPSNSVQPSSVQPSSVQLWSTHFSVAQFGSFQPRPAQFGAMQCSEVKLD